MFTFVDLQNEVKRRATRDQGGTYFDTGIKNAINTALFRTNREAGWRNMRRETTFDTVIAYSEGSGAGAFTEDSATVTITGATFLTDGIRIGRRIKLSGSGYYYTIKTITGETTLTLNKVYDGDDTTEGTYSILGQEEYNLPVQAGHKMFLWHDEYGYPFMLQYLPEMDFRRNGVIDTDEAVPEVYRMWSSDMVERQPNTASVVTIVSSSATDISIGITVFGTVSGYPDYEVITTDATDATDSVDGSKSFSKIDRIVKNATTIGRITATSNTASVTVAVLPVGDTTAGVMTKKVRLWPLPNTVFPMNVLYYKDTYSLVNDDDVHELGQEFDEAIILLATSKIKYESNQAEGKNFYAMYQDELKTLRKSNMDKIDWFIQPKRPYSGSNDYVNGGGGLQYRQAGSQYGRTSRY